MNRIRNAIVWVTYVAAGSMLLQGACLPDNFWSDKWGEVVNRTIIMGIGSVFDTVPGLVAY